MEADTCTICDKSFSFFFRRHHCRCREFYKELTPRAKTIAHTIQCIEKEEKMKWGDPAWDAKTVAAAAAAAAAVERAERADRLEQARTRTAVAEAAAAVARDLQEQRERQEQEDEAATAAAATAAAAAAAAGAADSPAVLVAEAGGRDDLQRCRSVRC
eukprot:SAG22_NODE_2256_length_2780_cov_20.080194_1_plen_158_part_00